MWIVKTILGVIIVVQIGLLIGLITMFVQSSLAERRHQKKRDEAAWADFVEKRKQYLYGPNPSSFATNYLLNEGFLLLTRKSDQELKLRASVGNERLLACFSVDRSQGTQILVNSATSERTVITPEFIKRWETTNYTEI